MKNQIAFAVVFMLAVLQMSAQKIKDVANPSIISWGTNFATPVSDPKWDNTNGKSYTKAKYADYTGETTVGMKSSIATAVKLNLDVEVNKGTLQVIVEDEMANIIFYKIFSGDRDLTADVALNADHNYKIRFIGLGTKGSYFCQWIEKTNL